MGDPQRNAVDLVVDGVPCHVPFSEQTICLCHDLLAQWTSRQRELLKEFDDINRSDEANHSPRAWRSMHPAVVRCDPN